MQTIRLTIIALIIPLLLFQPSYGSHLVGGDISWRALGSGTFQFKLKLYRDCAGVPGPGTASLITNAPVPGGSIQLSLIGINDLSYMVCSTCGQGVAGEKEEFLFQSAPIYLSGVPPKTGWYFTYDNCCRNGGITNLAGTGSSGMTNVSYMFPYQSNSANPAFDSSPEFNYSPITHFCTGVTNTYNASALDPDADSLVFSWAPVFDDYFGAFNFPVIPYAPGYNYFSPLPGPIQNPSNSGVSLDSKTGIATFLSYTTGSFATSVKVQSYKNGVLVAAVYREMDLDITNNCASLPGSMVNQAPIITPPFQDTSGQFTQLNTTVMVGDTVNFTINVTDYDMTATGSQNITIDGWSNVFPDSSVNPGYACASPPCATLSSFLPIGPTPSAASFNVNWITDCGHLVTGIANSDCQDYNMVISSRDDHCPTPISSSKTIRITVKDYQVVTRPILDSLTQLPNGDLILNWRSPKDKDSTFIKYNILWSSSKLGPFSLLDSVQSLSQKQYTHVGASGNSQSRYYTMETVSQNICQQAHRSRNSDTLGSVYTSIASIEYYQDLKIYPVPSNGIFIIESDFFNGQKLNFQLRNVLGQIVFQKSENVSQKTTINVAILPDGIYNLILIDEKGNRVFRKIIIG